MQGFPGDVPRCNHTAEFRGLHDDPVIPWNFEKTAPSQTDPGEMFAITIPSRVCSSPALVQISSVKKGETSEIRAPSRANPLECFSSHPTVGVLLFGPKVSDRLSSPSEEPVVRMKILLAYSL